jgi:LacI family transcriptional regulator
VALVIPDITNPVFPHIVRGAEQVLNASGYTVVLTDTNNDLDIERAQIAAMRAHGADGFIVATARWDDQLMTALAESGLPAVLVNRRTSGSQLPSVTCDDQRGIEMCVDHLADLGHRRIVHLAGPSDTSTGRERASAFRQAARARKLNGREVAVIECVAFSEESGAEAARKLIASRRSFTAIVAANDLLALGALTRFYELGWRCPDDVSITGFNDVTFMDKLTPPLTTVRIPLTEMGATAAKMLVDWIGQPQTWRPAQTLLPVELVVRGTTGSPARRAQVRPA